MRQSPTKASSHRRRLLSVREAGQGLVEYSMILLLIAVVAIAGVTLLGRGTTARYSDFNCAFGQAMNDASGCSPDDGSGG